MRAIVTGQVGMDKKGYLTSVRDLAADRGDRIGVYNVGDMMYAEAPDVRPGRILDLPLSRLNALRRAVFRDIIAESAEKSDILVNTHATFRWRHGLFSAARVWWTLRAFGHDEVAILDGGFPKWKREERPLSNLPIIPQERPFMARLNNLMVCDIDQVRNNIGKPRAQLLDARGATRFTGKAPEPREGIRSGHIPGSLNLPYGCFVFCH